MSNKETSGLQTTPTPPQAKHGKTATSPPSKIGAESEDDEICQDEVIDDDYEDYYSTLDDAFSTWDSVFGMTFRV